MTEPEALFLGLCAIAVGIHFGLVRIAESRTWPREVHIYRITETTEDDA